MSTESHGTNTGALWGGRFAVRPERRAGRAVEVDALRLAAGALRPRRVARARPGAARRRPADRGRPRRLLAGLDELGERYAAGQLHPRRVRRGRARRPGAALVEEVGPELGGRLRAGRSRNDQVATLFKALPARPRPAWSPASCSTWSTRSPTRPSSTSARSCPGRTHLQHAQPVLLSPPPAGARVAARARPRPAPRLGRPGRGRLAVRLRCPGRLEPRPGPAGGRPRPGLHRLERRTPSTAPRPGTSWRSSRSSPR